MVKNDPSEGWSPIVNHLLTTLSESTTSSTTRLQAAEVLDEILVNSIRISSEKVQARMHPLVLSSLAKQVEIVCYGPSLPVEIDIRRLGLEALYQILQSAGHVLVGGWEMVFMCLRSVCRRGGDHSSSLQTVDETSSQPTPSFRLSRGKKGSLMKGNASLVRTAFQSVRSFSWAFNQSGY